MATQSVDNVIAFNEARASRTSVSLDGAIFKRSLKPESLGVINDCRDMVLKRVCSALASTFDKIEDELFELAGKSADRETQNMYLDARTQAREKRPDIEAAFRSQFVSFFEKKVVGEEAAAKSANRFDKDLLSLVEDDALTENLAVNDIAKRLTNKCDEELRALSQRMGFLLCEPELADEANPIAPDTVVRALKAACDQMTAGFQTRLTILRMVERHMAEEMLSVYHDVNAHLVSQQVLPTLRPTFRRAQIPVVRKTDGGHSAKRSDPACVDAVPPGRDHPAMMEPAMAAAGGFGAFSTAALGMPPANHAAELFETLKRMMLGGASFGVGERAGGDCAVQPEYSSFTTGGFAPVPPRQTVGANQTAVPTAQTVARPELGIDSAASGALVSALSQMQQEWIGRSSSIATIKAMQNFVPGQTPASSLNVLRDIKSCGVPESSNQVDAMTIDIVAILFDYVFDDKSIPDTIKALIARLQIPVLKVAIIDRSFFAKKGHPVRRLLDALADASIAFAGEASPEDPLYKKIEAIVDRVHGEFDTDISLFDAMITEFEEFLKAREAANAEVIEQSARAMHEREKREMARLVALAEVDRFTNRKDLPTPVVAMLNGPWSRVLERIYLRDGGRSARFNDALETADQLIWSVQPKLGAGQRRDLVSALPLLLRRLQEGLDIANTESDGRQRFFTVLVDCHAAAVKAGLRGESVATLFASSRGHEAVAPLFEKLVAEERARAVAAANGNRTGIARIRFTENGVEFEELLSTDDQTAVASTQPPAPTVKAKSSRSTSAEFDFGETTTDGTLTTALGGSATQLKRGTWVEFIQAGGEKIHAKLSWVSPLKGVYLFTNPGATEALTIAPDALQRQLSRGLARILEESSLIDRAVDSMVSSLGDAAAT